MADPTTLAFSTFLHRSDIRRVLERAVTVDAPTAAGLEPLVPSYDSLPVLKRLREAGELIQGIWVAEIRAAYAALLAPAPIPIPPVAPVAAKALDRLPVADQPREKALRSGIGELDDRELVALLLRTGSGNEGVLELAHRLLEQLGGLAGLARAELSELVEVRGVGEAKASELAAACELGRRLAASALRERPVLDRPEAVAEYLAPLAISLAHERLWCLPLDARSRLIGAPRVISQGDVDGTDVPLKAILRAALQAGASSFIVAHNHPTGDPTPSASDVACTRRLAQAARTVELPLSDHVVVGDGGRWASLRRDHPGLWGH